MSLATQGCRDSRQIMRAFSCGRRNLLFHQPTTGTLDRQCGGAVATIFTVSVVVAQTAPTITRRAGDVTLLGVVHGRQVRAWAVEADLVTLVATVN